VVSARAFGELLGVTPATVGEWLEAGLPAEREGNGAWRISTALGVAWLEARARATAERMNETPADEADGRARKALADAALAELKLARLRGEVVPIEDYRREFGRVCTGLREVVMAIPARYAAQLVGCDSIIDVQARLREVRLDLLAAMRTAVQTYAMDDTAPPVDGPSTESAA
jgi:phage terminase Nu1 subunit (DNA packaging protein)